MATLRDLNLPRSRSLSARHLEVRFSRSSGPGGQRTNKVETKVDLRLNLEGAGEILTPAELARVRARLDRRLDADGCLQVVSQVSRDRSTNLEDALERMEALLEQALHVPKTRRKTKPSRRAKQRRINEKKQRGELKKGRSSGWD